MGGQGRGTGKLFMFTAAVMLVLFGALSLKRGWLSAGWAIALALGPMFAIQITLAFILDIRHKHWGWWVAPFIGWGGIWLALEGLHPGMGFFTAVTSSWSAALTVGLGSIAVILSFGVALLLTAISRQAAHSYWSNKINHIKERLGLNRFGLGGEIINGLEVDCRGDEGNRALTAQELAKQFPAFDENGTPKKGWVIGVAACPRNKAEADLLIGTPDKSRPQVSKYTGEAILSDQGKPTYCVKEGTATAELLIFDPVERDTHVLLAGETGGGKTSGYVLTSSRRYPHSLIIGDSKGEAWQATVEDLLAEGWTVVHFNPKRGDTYSLDVLSGIRFFNPTMLTDLETLAADLIPMDKNGDGQFYKNNVRKTVKGGIILFKFNWLMEVRDWLEVGQQHGYVNDVNTTLMNPDFIDGWLLFGLVKRFNTIRSRNSPKKVEWFNQLGTQYKVDGLNIDVVGFDSWLAQAPKHPTLDKIVRWMKKPFDQLQKDFIAGIAKGNEHIEAAEAAMMEPNPIILSMVGDLSGWEKPDPATAGNFVSSVNTDLAFMNNHAIARLLCGGTKKVVMPDEVIDGKHRVFINIDSDTMRANPGSVKLIYAAIGFAVTGSKRGKLPQGMTLGLLVDEMPQLRNFDLLHKTWLQEGRGKGFRIMGIIQTAQGLDDMTGEKTFKLWQGVCGAMCIFGLGDNEEAEKLEKIAGTFKAIITNDSGSKGAHSLDDGGPANLSTQREDQKVFSASRILKMKKYEQFLYVKGEGVAICAKSPYYLRPEFEGVINPNEKADPAFPDIEELYAEIELPETASLLFGKSGGAQIEVAKEDTRVTVHADLIKEKTKERERVFIATGGAWKRTKPSYWYIPKGKALAPFKKLDFVSFDTGTKPAPESDVKSSTKVRSAGKTCPACGATMAPRRDQELVSTTFNQLIYVCECGHKEPIRLSLGEAQAARSLASLGIPEDDMAQASDGPVRTTTRSAYRRGSAISNQIEVLPEPEDEDLTEEEYADSWVYDDVSRTEDDEDSSAAEDALALFDELGSGK